MKKVLLVFIAMLCTVTLKAQDGIEMGVFTGYMTNGKVSGPYGEFKIFGAQDYGAHISFPLEFRPGAHVELSYFRADTELRFKEYIFPERRLNVNSTTEYYQLGVTQAKDLGGKVFPYGQFTLGATRFNPSGSDFSEEWLFSITLGAGLKFYLSEKFGLRLQARALLPMKFEGVGVGFGTGGTSAGVYSRALLQGDFTGGVFFVL